MENSTTRYRNSRLAYLTLWCSIALGIIPAIVSDNLIPLEFLSPQIGVKINAIAFLPSTICLLILILNVCTCIVQRRYWMIGLLIPWLALWIFPVDELTFDMPDKRQVQHQWQMNQQLSKEGDALPDIDTIRDRFDQIIFTDSDLIEFDREKIKTEIDRLAVIPIKDNQDLIQKRRLATQGLRRLSANIVQVNKQIGRIQQALRHTNVIQFLSFGSYDKQLKNSLKKVKRHRDQLVSRQNVLRSELSSIKQASTVLMELSQLDATVETHWWLSQSIQSRYLTLLYGTLCFLILLVLIWQFSLVSSVFLFTLSASVIVSTLYIDAAVVFRFWILTKFVVASLVIKLAYQLYLENIPLLRKQTSAFNWQTLGKAIVYYWLFTLFILLGWYVSVLYNQFIDERLYSIKPMINSVPGKNTRRFDIDIALDTHFEKQEMQLHAKLDDWATKSKPRVADVAGKTVSLYEESIVETLPEINQDLDPPGCSGFLPWVFKPGQCAENEILVPLNNAYTEERNYQRDSLEANTIESTKRAGKHVGKAVQFAKQNLSDALLRLKTTIKQQLVRLYLVIDLFNWISWLMMILVIVKSFMYVFARIFFANDKNHQRIIQFETSIQPEQQGAIQAVSDKLELTPGMGRQLYINKRYDFANAPPDEITPQASSAFFSRLKNGVWHLNRINTRVASEDIPYHRIPDDERIVVWTIKPGDAVVFSWKTFVGMSDNIKIATRFSWQLSSLIFGRMFFVVARVDDNSATDGTLLLTARGSDGIKHDNPSNNPDQLLAWQTTTRFQLHANLSMRNVYRSGIQVRALNSDLAVMHLNEKKHRSGALTWLKYFLVPV